jgi:nucleoside-diphosphate-sugar epimerase
MAETPHDERDYFRVNTEGTRHVLQAAHAAKVRRFVFISTVATMSRHGEQLASHCDGQRRCTGLTEEDVIEPDTPYGCSKLEAEKLVLHGGYVPEPVVLRPCVVYGAGAKGNVQRMLRAVVNNRFPPMAEVGNLRSMVHFEDLIQAAILGAEKPQSVGETFIVSDGRNYSTRQIYECMCRAAGKRCPRWTVPFWSLKGLAIAGDLIGRLKGRRCSFDSRALTKLVGSAVFSSRKIESRLGYHPRWDLEAALPGMVDSISQERLGMNTGPVK